MMAMLKGVKIFAVSFAYVSLSSRLKPRCFWQIEIYSFYSLSNIRQTEFVFLNEPCVHGGSVPALSFSVASGSVNLFSAFPCIDFTFSLHSFSKWSWFMYYTAVKPKKYLLGYFDISWISLIFAWCCKYK